MTDAGASAPRSCLPRRASCPPPVRSGRARRAALGGACAALTLAIPATRVRASGLQDRLGSPDWSANAFAGMAAKGYDASTAWTNPAAMTRLPGNEVDSGINAVLPSIRFQGEDRVAGQPVAGSSGGNAGQAAAIPSLEAVWAATPDLRLGIAVVTPFGDGTAWPDTFVGRYQALVSSVSDMEIGPAVAYRLTPTLSVGAGPIIDRFTARLTSAINTGSLASLAGDPAIDMHGSDWAVGYHLGVLWQPTSDLRFGIDYRSRIVENLRGSQQVSIPARLATVSPAAAAELTALDQSVRTRVTLPDVLTVSAVWVVSPGLSALATMQWTHASLLRTISIVGSDGTTSVLPLHFRDSWMGSVGVNARPSIAPRFLLQAGVGFERGSVPIESRTPRLPGLDTVIAGAGLTFAVTPRLRLQAAYLHEFGLGAGSNSFSAAPSAGVLTGSYSMGVDAASLGMAWRF